MLNTQKLLYILPDVAYIAELLPGKKEHTFVIHSFRQINGEFLDDNDFLSENIQKLLSKLEADDYHLVLPDFLFTNTIVEVNETSENKIKEHLKEKLLPSLSLTKDSHELKTTILTEYGGKTKIQLSAIEKSVLNPIAQFAPENKIQITGISPLSWTIKSIVSLEPSISIIQMGAYAYLSLHYIGVDQTISDTIDNIETLGETIKTLKGAEPSIQTVYLLTNELVEEKLKEQLSDTLPLQQLTKPADEESQMPSYVKQIIESGMRTLSIEDFPVPQFPLGKPVAVTEAKAESVKDNDEVEAETEETAVLPAPTTVPAAIEPVTEVIETKELDLTAETESLEEATEEESKEDKEIDDDSEAEVVEEKEEAEVEDTTTTVAETNFVLVNETSATSGKTELLDAPNSKTLIESQSTVTQVVSPTPNATLPILKRPNPGQSMVRMLLISGTVFLATVGLGVGLGLAVITLTQKDLGQIASTTPSPSPAATLIPSPSPSPSPSPTPEIDKANVKILIVNATAKAGYAGETSSALKEAGFTKVTASNAKGDYEDGFIVLLEEEDTTMIVELEKATDLDLTFSKEKKTEDPRGLYDVVIVLAE